MKLRQFTANDTGSPVTSDFFEHFDRFETDRQIVMLKIIRSREGRLKQLDRWLDRASARRIFIFIDLRKLKIYTHIILLSIKIAIHPLLAIFLDIRDPVTKNFSKFWHGYFSNMSKSPEKTWPYFLNNFNQNISKKISIEFFEFLTFLGRPQR